MKTRLSTWSQNISPSPTLAVDAKAKALQAQGKDVCGFGVGEPNFDTPDFIKEAASLALQMGKTKYIPSSGLPELVERIANFYVQEKGVAGVKPNNIIVSPGGKFSCYLAILSVCGFGDEVIIPAPYWVSYPEMVKLAGATPVIVRAFEDNDFKITPAQLKAAITPKTKMLVLNSPSNPTGEVYSEEELKEIMKIVIENDIFVLSDEIYEFLTYDGTTTVSPASFSDAARERVIIASGFSKSYSMTGWRLGTICAPSDIAKAIADIQSQTTSNATTFAQYGALEAMRHPQKARESLQNMLTVFDRRRMRLLEGLNSIKGVTCRRANGAFYLFPNISSFQLSSTKFCEKLLEEELVALVPGFAFGADENVRLSYAVSDDVIEKGLERISRFCSRL